MPIARVGSDKPVITRGANGTARLTPTAGVGPQGLPGPGAAAWTALQAVTTGAVRQAPDGSWIKSTGSRTTRASFDATEQTFWVATLASAGTIEATSLAASIDQRAALPFERWWRKLGDDPATAKIVLSGDSTTSGATNLVNALHKSMIRGGPLDGMDPDNVVNHGNNGFLLFDYLANDPVPPNTFAETVAEAPDLIVASWLINDVVWGGATLEECIDRLTEYIGRLADDLPDCDVALRLPNPLLIGGDPMDTPEVDAGMHETIRAAYFAVRDLFPHVGVIDTAPVFGRGDLDDSYLMSDRLHPKAQAYWNLGFYIAKLIGLPGREEPRFGPPRRYIRTGFVTAIGTNTIDIVAKEWPGGDATPVAMSAIEWVLDATSEMYGSLGVADFSTATKTEVSDQTVRYTKSGFDFTTITAEGELVQLVGDNPGEGAQSGGVLRGIDPPNVPAHGYASLGGVPVPGARPGRAVIASKDGIPSGLTAECVAYDTDLVQIRFQNGTGSDIDPSYMEWNFWVIR